VTVCMMATECCMVVGGWIIANNTACGGDGG
jgi:hypothetical protein